MERTRGGWSLARPRVWAAAAALSVAVVLLLALPACSGPPGPSASASGSPGSPNSGGSGGPGTSGSIPPIPPTPTESLGPSQPPVIYVGGTLTEVAPDHLELRETSGSVVRLQRLAGGATSFFRVSGGAWLELASEAQVSAGGEACVETLMDGTNLLAIRVFLGARCGPA